MALDVTLEDDLFFADLYRKISFLIDEDDDDYNYPAVSHFPSIFPHVCLVLIFFSLIYSILMFSQ